MADNPQQQLSSLKIDRSQRRRDEDSGWTKWWIILGVLLLVGFGAWRMFFAAPSAVEVSVMRVRVETSGASGSAVVLNAAGYVVPAHKIEVASKLSGRVEWIGVEKGDGVKRGQVLVRLEDDEFQARVRQSKGNLAALQARRAELEAGSRPEEIQRAQAQLDEARADLEEQRLDLGRTKELAAAGVVAAQELDRNQARFDAQSSRAQSLERAFELVRIGPRIEQIDAVRGQVQQAVGQLEYDQTLLASTLIRAPVTGTILERNVEIGEFVTTSFVGERGAKGYVVSLADLEDIQVELDISQDDFSKLRLGTKGVVTTDAFRDREYEGEIAEISPEADRQKATVQVKVQILNPDELLRPEMNANVAFLSDDKPSPGSSQATGGAITIPASAVRNGQVYLFVNGQAVARQVEVRRSGSSEAEVVSGLTGGEDLIVDPPENLTDGAAVLRKSS